MAVLFYRVAKGEELVMSINNNEKSGLATAGMVLGIIAVLLSFIPIINNVAFVLGVLALIFGAIPLFKKKSVGKSIAGVVMGILSIAITLMMQQAFSDALDEVIDGGSVQQSEASQDAEEVAEFGTSEPITFDGATVTVTNVERNWDPQDGYTTPSEGSEYVRVQVEIKNDSDKRISYNTFDWKIQNSNGQITDMDMAGYGEGSLGSGELSVGGSTSGALVFEAPAGDEGLVLHYEPSFWSNRGVEIKL